jgi:peptidoglycan/LPS O-acetylase OafA/YrhL
VSAYILLNPVLSDLGWVDEYTGKVIRGTYMLRLNPSIGYVWVIRVFLIVMLLTPLLLWLDRRIGKNWACLALVGVFVAVQQGLAMWLKPSENILIKDWALYVFGYSAVFLLGLRVKNMSKRSLAGVTALLAILVAGTAVYMNHEYGTIMRLQATKYPPQLYYLLWGMCMSCLLWLTSGLWKCVLDKSLFTFIGRNTIWIYLWHIPFVNIVVGGPFDHWHPVLKYVFVYIGALCLYGIQYYLVKKADTRWKNNKITRYFVG